jgi:hypothetical protein
MSEQELIHTKLRAVASRLQLMAMLRFVARVGLWTCAVLLVVLGGYKVFPFPFSVVQGAFIAAAVLLVGACVVGFLRRVSLAAAARFADQKLSLKERLSSAVELGSYQLSVIGSSSHEPRNQQPITNNQSLTALLLHDAAQHAQSLNPKEILPLHLPKHARWVAVLLVAIVGLAFAPEYRTAEFKEQQRAKADVKKEGEKITGLVKRIEQSTKPAVLQDMRKELTALNDLGEQFKKVQVSKENALKDINTVTDKIRKKQDELGENKALRTLSRRAASSSATEPNAQQKEQLQKKIDDLQKKLGSNPPSPEQIEKTKAELQKALDKIKQSPNPNTPEGKEAKQALEKAIDSAMQQAKEYGNVGDSLDKALEAMKNADVDLVAKNITDAVRDMEQMKKDGEALARAQQQQAQQQAQKAGKDLAEQLAKGQAQAAKETLEKFMQQVQQSNFTDQQKQQMAQELMKALDPAKDYGKVGENLEQAVSQLAKNDKTGAANSMQAAAEELQKLMDQQAEGQQLADALEQLKQSQCQIATGNCQGDKCQSGVCKGGTSGVPKGKGNRGFGDWPDESNTQVPEYSENWDNEGLTRDNKDPKGVADRGDPKITGKTTPTKVQGKMQNAGPMPGITLKGVSIKGQSNVEMEQATGAAKQEAEDALNKEQIPKSYQGQVKEYFDSLK